MTVAPIGDGRPPISPGWVAPAAPADCEAGSPMSKLEVGGIGLGPQNDVSICFVPGEPPDRIVESELMEPLEALPAATAADEAWSSDAAAARPSAGMLAEIRLVRSIGSRKSVALASIILFAWLVRAFVNGIRVER